MAEQQIPAVPAITPGNQTSEHAMVSGAQTVATIVTVIGTLTTAAEPILSANQNTRWGIIGGAVLAVLGIISKCAMALGYTSSRTVVKTAQK